MYALLAPLAVAARRNARLVSRSNPKWCSTLATKFGHTHMPASVSCLANKVSSPKPKAPGPRLGSNVGTVLNTLRAKPMFAPIKFLGFVLSRVSDDANHALCVSSIHDLSNVGAISTPPATASAPNLTGIAIFKTQSTGTLTSSSVNRIIFPVVFCMPELRAFDWPGLASYR